MKIIENHCVISKEIDFKFVPGQHLCLTAYNGPNLVEAADIYQHLSRYKEEKTSIPFAYLIQPIQILSISLCTDTDPITEKNLYRIAVRAITV